MKRSIVVLLLVLGAAASYAQGVPSAPTPRAMVDSTGNLLSDTYPAPVKIVGASCTGAVPVVGTITVTIATITAALATGTNHIGSVNASITAALPAGTNTIGSASVQPMDSALGSATANPTSPFATLLYLTDNSSLQRWFTAIVQGDGVNGNNTAGVAPWVFNGATFDRQRGSAATGTLVFEHPAGVPSHTVILLDGTDQAIVSVTNRKWISLHATGTFEFEAGAAAVTANTTPCYNAEFDCPASWPIAVKTSATGTYLTIRQGGD